MKKGSSSRRSPGKKDAQAPTTGGIPAAIPLASPSTKTVQVKHLAEPPPFVKPKRIHARHVLPLVREGLEREFHSFTPPTVFHSARSLAAPMPAATDDLVLITNSELLSAGQQGIASNVDEPSVAVSGDVLFYSGNWYAARSVDGGKTFQYIDPATAFRAFDPPNSGFCCDQVVHYISQIDTFVWLLQYGPETGDNIQRLALAKTQDVVDGRWRLFDITTQALGVPGAFLDFPDLALGANCLYVTTNIFQRDGQVGAAVVRIPVSSIDGGAPAAQPFVSMDFQSFRVAQNCGTIAYFAAHEDTSTLRLFSWDETQGAPTSGSVGVARWIGSNGYQSRAPDGRRWLDRADPRITGATLANNELWFAWSVDSGSNRRPRPFVQIARIAATNMTLIENINVFDIDSATCYGALNTNVTGEVGISYMIGGGSRFPSHMVGILTGTRRDVLVAAGERGPLPDPDGKGQWGDFLTVRRVFPAQDRFAATGYTLKGSDSASSPNRDATPRFVVFGRSGDGAAPPAPPGGGTTVRPPAPPRPPTPVGPGPITDVNALPLVGAAAAAQIKAAAGVTTGPVAAAPMAAPMAPEIATKPGKERWSVKTGRDADVAAVGKNVIGGQDLGAGIVSSTVEELVTIPRPPEMPDPTVLNPAFDNKRSTPVECVIWQVDATITVLKLEGDGDYHLVLQGPSGRTIIGEVPTPTPIFIGNSPWAGNIGEARRAVDDKLVSPLSPANFVLMGDTLVPRESVSVVPRAMPALPVSFRTPLEGLEATVPMFQTSVPPTPARITGVGFFDKVHGQTGVSLSNGIELHPILKIEWL